MVLFNRFLYCKHQKRYSREKRDLCEGNEDKKEIVVKKEEESDNDPDSLVLDGLDADISIFSSESSESISIPDPHSSSSVPSSLTSLSFCRSFTSVEEYDRFAFQQVLGSLLSVAPCSSSISTYNAIATLPMVSFSTVCSTPIIHTGFCDVNNSLLISVGLPVSKSNVYVNKYHLTLPYYLPTLPSFERKNGWKIPLVEDGLQLLLEKGREREEKERILKEEELKKQKFLLSSGSGELDGYGNINQLSGIGQEGEELLMVTEVKEEKVDKKTKGKTKPEKRAKTPEKLKKVKGKEEKVEEKKEEKSSDNSGEDVSDGASKSNDLSTYLNELLNNVVSNIELHQIIASPISFKALADPTPINPSLTSSSSTTNTHTITVSGGITTTTNTNATITVTTTNITDPVTTSPTVTPPQLGGDLIDIPSLLPSLSSINQTVRSLFPCDRSRVVITTSSNDVKSDRYFVLFFICLFVCF
jgi:hypothetical protein